MHCGIVLCHIVHHMILLWFVLLCFFLFNCGYTIFVGRFTWFINMLYWTTLSWDWTVKFGKNVCSTCHIMTKSLFNLSYYDQFKYGMTTFWFNIHIVRYLGAFNLNKLYILMNYHNFVIFHQVTNVNILWPFLDAGRNCFSFSFKFFQLIWYLVYLTISQPSIHIVASNHMYHGSMLQHIKL